MSDPPHVTPRATPNVFTLEPGAGALKALIHALMCGDLLGVDFASRPERLADLVLHVPNKRLKSSFEAALKRELGPRPVILPKILLLGAPGDALETLGDEDIERLALEQRVISPLERRFHLLPLVQAWRARLADRAREGATDVTLRETLSLAGALGSLIDEMTLSGVTLSKLESAAPPGYDPSRFDDYWAQSRRFLQIAAERWPEALREFGAVDGMAAQLARLASEALRLQRDQPLTPMLILGSTGSVAATGQLMRAVSRLAHGAVVLPGLDTALEAADFALLGPTKAPEISLATQFAHPQAMLKRTLSEIGIPREAVKVLAANPAQKARREALSDMMRPAERVAQWRTSRSTLDETAAFAGIAVIEAADEHEEALAIALAMRETLNERGKTVALVTPDRLLARRVQTELSRWGIAAADAAGSTLRESPAGTFLLLLLDAAAEEPGALMALLGHPLARFGFAREDLEALSQALDLAVLRGHRFLAQAPLQERVRHGIASITPRAHPGVLRIPVEVLARLPAFAKVLDEALAPYRPAGPAHSLPAFAGTLAQSLEETTRDEVGQAHFSASPDGGAVIALLHALHDQEAQAPQAVLPAALPGALALLLGEKPLPPAGEEHPRALLLGPFEARLIEADRIILGMLNETRFPPAAREDPFLNRAMRLDLGLQAPEWRIGASAHDFAQLCAAPEVILTRAKRMGDAPALPSRFLRRFEAYAGVEVWKALLARGETFIAMAQALDAPEGAPPTLTRPCPVPEAPRLPDSLSITEIETLRRDPYALYARHILKLVPLAPPDEPIDARDRGTLLHAILERYAAGEPPKDPEEALHLIEDIAADVLAPLAAEPELFQFWRRRFQLIAPGFIAFDRAAREQGRSISVESRGHVFIDLPDGARLRLSGRADRIERDSAGRLSIFDYKTGRIPRDKDIARGDAPQLPITAALAARGGFGARGEVAQLAHIDIGGSGPFRPVPVKSEDIAALAEADWNRLVKELSALSSGAQGYLAQKSPIKDRAGDYDHLTRRSLWAEPDEDSSEEET